MKVMLATDGSTCAHQAIDYALRFLPREQLELVVASIAPFPSPYLDAQESGISAAGATTYSELVEVSKQRALEAVEKVKPRLAEAQVPLRYVVRQGDPIDQLLQVAREEWPDLIVLGSHGRGLLGRAMLGSVSEGVLHGWHGAVLVIRGATPAAATRPASLVRDVASGEPIVASAEQPLRVAARMMAEEDLGALPVVLEGPLVGMLSLGDLAELAPHGAEAVLVEISKSPRTLSHPAHEA